MAKSKNPKKRENKARESKARESQPAYEHPNGFPHVIRETVESIVIAFVLAFLFRTFEAEAFVIPTGSMSPSLQGRHKDVDCSECGYRFRVSASDEESEFAVGFASEAKRTQSGSFMNQEAKVNLRSLDTVGGVCPMCRQIMPMRYDLTEGPDNRKLFSDDDHTSYPGDRILVNKYGYSFSDPQRWDVVVFKFPGNGEMNYIKRLVGLPGEEIQLYQGDVFTRPLDSKDDFQIERKPADKVAAMLQPVHDSHYESSLLFRAGWPLRWSPDRDSAWEVKGEPSKQAVTQQISIQNPDAATTDWLRYRHFIPTENDWLTARQEEASGDGSEKWPTEIRPSLISDFNSYNTSLYRGGGNPRVQGAKAYGVLDVGWGFHRLFADMQYGGNWVGDLAVACEIDVESENGELLLDLVEGGKHFTCTIDLATGQATLSIEGVEDFQPQAQTSVQGAGSYDLKFANVDDRLLLWVDGSLVDFGDSSYSVKEVFGKRKEILPQTSEDDPGDLAPVGVGSRGASLRANRLQVLRDIYYIAVEHTNASKDPDPMRFEYHHWSQAKSEQDDSDGSTLPALDDIRDLFTKPENWARFRTREPRRFATAQDQFFVMGDNSPASLDCRLWSTKERGNYPGGPYLDRRLLTGKAVCVFWPHSWGSFPLINKLPGFPNFGDMRIVR